MEVESKVIPVILERKKKEKKKVIPVVEYILCIIFQRLAIK